MYNIKLKILGEWWFGTDIMDLMRIMTINTNDKNSNKYTKLFKQYFLSVPDDLQSVLDRKKICGDVHMVICKK